MSFVVHLVLMAFGAFHAAETRSKHAARGVARRARSGPARHFVSSWGGVSDVMPASQLVWHLKRERIRAARYA